MISVIKKRNIWFALSGTLFLASVILLFTVGLRFGIDFTGGSLLEVTFDGNRPNGQKVVEVLSPLEIGNIIVQPISDKGMVIRFSDVDEQKHQEIVKKLKEEFNPLKEPIDVGDAMVTLEANVLTENRFESVGPVIGNELRRRTIWALIVVCIAIIGYIAFAFRKVSKPVSSWWYGLFAVIALVHDVTITAGVFVVLGKLYNLEVNAPFVAALLTILGFSVNDTIVIFDRIRENLLRRVGEKFEDIIDISVNEVMVRSINTSFTVLLTLFAILLFGGSTIRDFVLALIVGVTVGSYSSIFLASPMLVVSQQIRKRRSS